MALEIKTINQNYFQEYIKALAPYIKKARKNTTQRRIR
jgi:hypothetical protein